MTFVNPEPGKGIYVFARIAEVLSRQRPDIRLLLVEGVARIRHLAQFGIDLGALPNLDVLPNSSNAARFLAATKLLLMPSLWNESFGLVAAEAMLNGIPVIASNRGALRETIGDAGILLDIPAKYRPETRAIPTIEEVEPWIEAITRLWDDAAEYDRLSRAARERAQHWHPDRVAPIYREFFGNITHQPGPPLVPREAVGPPPAAVPPPTALNMAASLAGSMARFALSGFKRVDEERHRGRVDACEPCQHRRDNRCLLCGCFFAKKAWLPHEDCPIGKWPD